MPSPPIASVIVVNWQGGGLVEQTLESLLSQTIAKDLKIIVVDNGSTDGSPDAIEKTFGRNVGLIRLKTNLGFAAGNNLGFEEAEGEYLLLLNNDAVATPTWAERLIEAASSRADVGMCTSKILRHDNPRQIDNVGFTIFLDGLNRSRGHMQIDDGRYDLLEETLFASGCAALYRRRSVMEMGGFDEDFFAYGDDVDLGLKLRLLGASCLYVPSAVAYHRQSASSNPVSARKLYWIERNRIWILIKYFPLDWILISPLHTLRRLLGSWQAARRGQGVAGEVAKKNSPLSLLFIFGRAWLDALLGAPKMWRRRRRLLRKRKLSGRQWRTLLRQYRASLEDMKFGG